MTYARLVKLYDTVTNKLEILLWDILLLAVRLVLANGFYTTGSMKWENIAGVAEWFAELKIPFPTVNAYLAASTEVAGVVLLTIGLATRFISIPLIITMIVAIVTVHWGNGFEAGNNGFEIPLYYMLFLLLLVIKGSGKLGIDHFIKKKIEK